MGMPVATKFCLCLFTIAITFITICGSATARSAAAFGAISEEQARFRHEHSQELLGKYYGRSSVRFGENVPKINSQIYRWTRERLPARYKANYQRIAQAIIDESLKYEFDPVFLLSIIQTESHFNPDAVGTSGEIGLMQILPATAEWISSKAVYPWNGPKTLLDPIKNIRIGAAYLGLLRDRFDMHARLYIAAYNMGQGNVEHAQARKIWPKDYPGVVMRNYVEFYEELKEKHSTSQKRSLSLNSDVD
jgi:soluble lytic murein transglycosylase